jgi:hypothetical protein
MIMNTDGSPKLPPDVHREAAANLPDDVAVVTGRNIGVIVHSEVGTGYRGVEPHIQQLNSHLDAPPSFPKMFSATENGAIFPIGLNSFNDDTELGLKIRRKRYNVELGLEVKYLQASFSIFNYRHKEEDRSMIRVTWLLFQHLEAEGPLQPFYAILGTQVSLLFACVKSKISGSEETWNVEVELREAFE